MKILNWTITIAISLLTGCFFGGTAQAQAQQPAQAKPTPRVGDVFNRAPETNTGGAPNLSVAQHWFKSFDTTIAAYKPTVDDKFVMTRPSNKEVERVNAHRSVVAKIAKNYHELARHLREMDVPTNLTGVTTYRDRTADWFDDAASVYQELIKPKQPAKTIEELDEQLAEVKNRAQAVQTNKVMLSEMDRSLRKTFKVHMNDALWNYVSGK
jgi:hypothetical protein